MKNLKRLIQTQLFLLSSTLVISLAFAADPAIFLPKPAPPAWWPVSGETWSALFVGGKTASVRYELKTVQAKIYVDSRDHVLKLGAQNSPDPLVFIRDLQLAAGVVKTATGVRFGLPTAMKDKDAIEFQYSGQAWKLTRETKEKKAVSSEKMEAHVQYTLTGNSKSDVFGPLPCLLDLRLGQTTCAESINFNFIGDLDRDGRPDLFGVQNRAAADGVDTPFLWLSKKAQLLTLAEAANTKAYAKPFRALTSKAKSVSQLPAEILIPNAGTKPVYSTTSGDAWWGVDQTGASSTLQPYKIWVACVEGLCEETNFVGLANPGTPDFLIRTAKTLKKGPIETAEIKVLSRNPDAEMNYDSFALTFLKAKLRLTGGSGLFTLESDKKKVTFPLKTADPDDKPKLFWAGDVDRDGLIDLLFQYPIDEGTGYALYLSPEAATGPINAPTAETTVLKP